MFAFVKDECSVNDASYQTDDSLIMHVNELVTTN